MISMWHGMRPIEVLLFIVSNGGSDTSPYVFNHLEKIANRTEAIYHCGSRLVIHRIDHVHIAK